MLVIGGRTNNVTENLPLEVFDTETSEWTAFNSIQRFRHGSWVFEKNIFVYGGFELSTPNIPTDAIFKINLQPLFKGHQALLDKVQGTDLNSSISSINSNNSANSNNTRDTVDGKSRGPSTPTIPGSQGQMR